jgi:hypothetical protein
LPLIPKNDPSKVLLRIWWDNFDSKVENTERSIHTCHGVAFTEISPDAIIRNMNDVQVPRSKRNAVDPPKTQLSCSKIIPHKLLPTLDSDSGNSYYKNM